MTASLSPREQQILDMIARGYSNPEIARELGTHIQTVKTQVSGLFEKIGAKTRAHAITLSSPVPTKDGTYYLTVTPHEHNLIRLIAYGTPNAEIARRLGTSPDTIKNQINRLFQKFGATHRAHLVALAWTYGFLTDTDLQGL